MKHGKTTPVLPWVIAGFLAPPVFWLGFGLYFSIWDFAGLMRIIISPWIWSYVALFVGLVVLLVQTNLRRVDAHLGGATGPEAVRRAQQGVNRIPWIFLIVMSVYCVVGPNVALLGQTLNDPFLDSTEYILAWLLGIPLILIFTIPFFLQASAALEERAQGVVLHDDRRYMTLSAKIAVSAVLNVIGSALTLVIAALSLSYEADWNSATAFGDIVGKIVITGAIVVVIGTANVLLIMRQIVYPIRAFSTSMSALFQELAQGKANLNQGVSLASRDELGYLARNFGFFLTTLRRLVTHIKSSVDETTQGSTALAETSSNSTELITRAASQADSIQNSFRTLRSEIEEGSETMTDVAGFVEAVSESIGEQQKSITDSSGQVESMAASLRELHGEAGQHMDQMRHLEETARSGEQEMRQSVQTIRKLAESTGSIQQAASVIADIAERTHLLAMNAAIEAAKAGMSGEGFSVVAGEIKKLAQSTRQNSNEISESLEQVTATIEASQSDAVRAGESFGSMVGTIGEVAEATGRTTEALQQISQQGEEVAANLRRLVESSADLEEAGEGMQTRIQTMRDSLQSLSALSERTGNEVQSIVETVNTVQDLVSSADTFVARNEEQVRVLTKLVGGFAV